MKRFGVVFRLLLLLGSLTQIFGSDVSGIWTGRVVFRTAENGDLERDLTVTLKAIGPNVTGTLIGTWEGHGDSVEILDGRLDGDVVLFSVASGADDMPRIEFVGRQDGDELKLAISATNRKSRQEWKFGDGRLKRAK